MTVRLVTLDLDGTLLVGDTAFAAILRANGHGLVGDETDAAYARGELDEAACFWRQWEYVQRLTLADMHRGLRKAPWLPGIGEGVARLREAGLQVALLTDQPTCVTDFLGRWGLTDAIASPCEVKGGSVVRVDARFGKWANLREALAKRGLRADEVLHVGNGPNDVPVWREVGGSVAVFAKPEVTAQARHDLGRPADLLAVAEAVLAGRGVA